jgi:hypothetical protein
VFLVNFQFIIFKYEWNNYDLCSRGFDREMSTILIILLNFQFWTWQDEFSGPFSWKSKVCIIYIYIFVIDMQLVFQNIVSKFFDLGIVTFIDINVFVKIFSH